MQFVGVDLHKKTIVICVVEKVRGKLNVAQRRKFSCRPAAPIAAAQDRHRPTDACRTGPPGPALQHRPAKVPWLQDAG